MRTLIEQHMGRCRYFTGIQHRACEKGVAYDSFRGAGVTLPCLDWTKEPRGTCEFLDFPTLEEAQEHERECHRDTENMMIARKAIVQATGGKRGCDGSIECPVCKTGVIRFSVAGYNGHIHAACSTDGCVGWME